MVYEGPSANASETPEGIKLLWNEIVKDFRTHVFHVVIRHNGLDLSGKIIEMSDSGMALESSGKAFSKTRWGIIPTKDAPVKYLAITSKKPRLISKSAS